MMAAAVKAGHSAMPVEKDIAEQLIESGVPLESISAVVWSHTHADHTGPSQSLLAPRRADRS
jgi:ribonuclease BN (tRNA processing enzyme)